MYQGRNKPFLETNFYIEIVLMKSLNTLLSIYEFYVFDFLPSTLYTRKGSPRS